MASDRMSRSTRRDDDRVLAWLSDALLGGTSAQIAKNWGRNPELVRATFQRIRADDLKFSGEPASDILPSYPWMRP